MEKSNIKAAQVEAYCDAAGCDLVVASGDIGEELFKQLLAVTPKRTARLKLIILTRGGNPDEGYKIGRLLQRNYEKLTFIFPGACASAGTLIALAADELAFTTLGYLGPLDMQLRKRDEFQEFGSALNLQAALQELTEGSYRSFGKVVESLKEDYPSLTLKFAAGIAERFALGLYSPISAQLDPLTIGERRRSVRVAHAYGSKLAKRGGNLKDKMLQRLIEEYPSHNYIIDQEEASEIFNQVRSVDGPEARICEQLSRVFSEDGLFGKIPYAAPVSEFIDWLWPSAADGAEDNGAAGAEDRSNRSETGANSSDPRTAQAAGDSGPTASNPKSDD